MPRILARNPLVSKAFLIVFLFSCANMPAFAQDLTCKSAVAIYEELYQIPNGLLAAISKVESNHNPYALNDGLRGYQFASAAEVLSKMRALLDTGHPSFDVGCTQLNYRWHGKHFNSAEEMLDVRANVRYAAGLLRALYQTHGSWHRAVRLYHSHQPQLYKRYSRKVALAWDSTPPQHSKEPLS